MKILKYIGIALLSIIVLALIAAAFVKKDFHFEKSTEINAPKDVVWQNVVMFSNHEKWSQWKEMDPNMKTEITGTDGTVGAKMSWSSTHKDVGTGSQTITNIIPGERVDSELDFGGQGKANTFMAVSGDSTKCKATWSLDMHADYPFNLIVSMVAESGMNSMFDKGLAMLKTASEKK